MAQYNGYVSVPHATYDQFRNATLGNGYNVDGYYGNQCWDFCALLWWQYGLTLYTGTRGYAKECWTQSRSRNAVSPFIAIEGRENIKRGDCVVFNSSSPNGTGHIAFADEDWSQNRNGYLYFLGQNQGQGSANPSNIASIGTGLLLGIFRNTDWDNTPPTPPIPPIREKGKFPFYIIARKRRDR